MSPHQTILSIDYNGPLGIYDSIMDDFFVVTAPGLEPLAAEELRRLGLLSEPVSAEPVRPERHPMSRKIAASLESGVTGSGGVAFRGDFTGLYRANLHLRTASRVLIRLGSFYAAAFPELRKKASRLSWERFLQPGQPVALNVTCHKSRLYHSDAVAERVAGAIGDRLKRSSPMSKAKGSEAQTGDSDETGQPQLIVVRIVNDLCTISIDSSGELLNRRGYRQAGAKAPLRETLAAAMLYASGWDTVSPLLDPFCGSGTIAIEAALLSMGIPPGRNRHFRFMDWQGYNPARWEALLAERPSYQVNPQPRIQASDRDAGAIQSARANAARAGVEEFIEFKTRAVSAIQPPPEPGWVVTNPPYGIRVSANKDLRNLYAQFGNVLRRSCPGWKVAILCSDLTLLGQTHLSLDTSFSTLNGGVKVRLARGEIDGI